MKKKTLNKHRTLRSPLHVLQKTLKGIDASATVKKLLSLNDRSFYPKVHDFMTVTAAEDADDIISFLKLPTSTTFTFLTDLSTAYAYLTPPSINSLALYHHLKEELLLRNLQLPCSFLCFNRLCKTKSSVFL